MLNMKIVVTIENEAECIKHWLPRIYENFQTTNPTLRNASNIFTSDQLQKMFLNMLSGMCDVEKANICCDAINIYEKELTDKVNLMLKSCQIISSIQSISAKTDEATIDITVNSVTMDWKKLLRYMKRGDIIIQDPWLPPFFSLPFMLFRALKNLGISGVIRIAEKDPDKAERRLVLIINNVAANIIVVNLINSFFKKSFFPLKAMKLKIEYVTK